MNREEFLAGLARLLADIPESERQEALKYYSDYFDDAGPENEKSVIQELGGTPERAAASIRAEFLSGKTSGPQNYGEYTEQGYQDTRIPHPRQMPQFIREKTKGSKNPWKIAMIALILVLTGGLWLGFFSGILGLIFGLLSGVLAFVFGIAVAVLSLIVSGIALIAAGIAECLGNPALGFLMSGLGFLLLAVGILLLILCLWLGNKFLPRFVDWIYKILRKFVDWCKAKWKIFR